MLAQQARSVGPLQHVVANRARLFSVIEQSLPSRYQILKSEWRSVTNSLRYADPQTARNVTLTLLERRGRAFRTAYHRNPTDFEFYGLWNAPGQVLEGRVSPRVAERCRRYANLCAWNGAPTRVVSASTPAAPLALVQLPGK